MFVEINPYNIDSRLIQQAVDELKQGKIIIFPTDTVYAFGWAAPDQVSKGREYVPLETTARIVSQPVDEYALILNNKDVQDDFFA